MSWARFAIEKLKQGQSATVHPHGNSMTPRIKSGDEIVITPIQDHDPDIGDVVLVHCRGNDYLHLVKAIRGNQYMITNNHGHVNGWVSRQAIYGRAQI